MISFNSVTKAFGDDSVALQDVSFTIEPGELVVVTGPSGSGKTTLMRLLTKEYEPTSGEIIFNDQSLSDIKGSKVHQLRRQIGVVFQDYKLLPELNVWENIALSLYIIGQKQDEIEQRVTDLLRLISLDDKPFLFPSQLSGGEAQRVSIARALATAPSVIFADEPTGNLDAETSASIARLLQKINKLGTTVLIATHDTGVLDLMKEERHIRLEHGQLVKDEKAAETAESKKKAKPIPAPETEAESTTSEENQTEEPETKSEITESNNESSSSEAQLPKKNLLGKIWPFGKKTSEPEIVVTEVEESVITLGPPESDDKPEKPKPPKPEKAEETEKPKTASKPKATKTEKTESEAPKKPESTTKVDAKVKVESL